MYVKVFINNDNAECHAVHGWIQLSGATQASRPWRKGKTYGDIGNIATLLT